MVDEMPTEAPRLPLQPFASPFVGQSAEDISRQLQGSIYFAVLDGQSMSDETVTLGELSDGKVETVRLSFYSAQSLLISLGIGTLGLPEIQHIAAKEGGVYKQQKPEATKKGGPTARELLSFS
ncbi:hypothetical protein F4811DRAFT_229253 [Daldinia bambusicola]|nr:hypothetical protein F4811DRAFT_229253 [Daldinia bambusicola]